MNENYSCNYIFTSKTQIQKLNFRSSLSDCQQALKFQPNYSKAKLRAAQCCAKLKLYDEALQYASDILEKEPNEPTALKIQSESKINKVS